MKKNKIKKNIKEKNGFTLIELLAVIIILAILMLIAVPGILNIMNKSKKNAFKSQAETIYKAARTQAASEAAGGDFVSCYSRVNGNSKVKIGTADADDDDEKILDLSGSTDVDYMVSFDGDGKITGITVYDRGEQYSITGTSINEINDKDVDTEVASNPVTQCP